MNIIIDIRCLTEKHRSGVGEYTHHLLRHIFEQDRKNSYYLFYNAYHDVSDNIPAFEYENVYLISSRWPNKLFSFCVWLAIIKLDRFVQKRIVQQYNMFNNFNIDYFFAPNINVISLSKKIKFIVTVHDVSFVLFKKLYSWKRRLWHRFVGPQTLIQRADYVVCPSKNTMRDIKRVYTISEKNMHVVYPSIALETKNLENIDILVKKYKLPAHYILCVCTLEPRKNIIALLESFSLLPKTLQQQFPLVLLGGRGWRDDDIIWRIDNTAYVHYIGYVSDAEKTVLFRHASLFVFPSLYEGFGMPLLEAMTMKIPCIASNRPALTELGGDGVYFVDPHNIMMISQGIETLLSNQSLRDSITKKAYIQSKNFSWEKSAKEFLNLIV